MKKLFLSLALLFAGISGSAVARHCRRNSCNPCPTRCEKKCPVQKCVNACAKKAECEKCPCPAPTCTKRYITVPAMVPRIVWEQAECAHEVVEECHHRVSQKCISGIQPRGTAAAKFGAENVTEYSDEEYANFAGEGCF